MTQSKQGLGIVVLILLVAAALHIIGLTFGQPENTGTQTAARELLHYQTPMHPDEFFYVALPFEMLVKGRRNPRFFENPSFLIYLNYITFGLTGSHAGVDAADWEGLSLRTYAPFQLYVIGRLYSALGGLLGVAAVMATVKLISNRRAMLISGAVAAVSLPLNQHAHYATTSSLAAGFVMVSIWAAIAALKFGGRRYLFILAGVAAGLASGSRYNASAVSILVFVTGLVMLYRWRDRTTLITVMAGWFAFPLTFLLTTPYALLDFGTFWEQFRGITGRFAGGEGVRFATENGLFFEYRYIALFGLGLPAAIASIIGLLVLLKRQRVYALLLLVFLVPYSWFVLNTVLPEIGDQLTLPVLPVLAGLSGIGVNFIAEKSPLKSRLVTAILVVAVVAMPLSLSVQADMYFRRTDTRIIAQRWINEHIPDNATFHLIGAYNVPLDEAMYNFTHSVNVENMTVEKIDELNPDVVVVSDAVYFFNRRLHEKAPAEYIANLNTLYGSYGQIWREIHRVERPHWAGYDWIGNNATYWHHPTITIFCRNLKVCGEIADG